MKQLQKAECIAYEIRLEFDIAEDEEITKDVFERFCQLSLLENAYRNREIMFLDYKQACEKDAEAKSQADKPNYRIRWLLFNKIKEALKIKTKNLQIEKGILFEDDIERIVKVIKENKRLLIGLGFSIDKDFEEYPFNTIRKLLIKQLDLNAIYKRGTTNGTKEEQDGIIEYYKAEKIYQKEYGVGKNGWTQQLRSREKRWKYAREDILALSFGKHSAEQKEYYLAITPHLEVENFKHEWGGKNPSTQNSNSLISNFNQHLSEAEKKLLEHSLGDLE